MIRGIINTSIHTQANFIICNGEKEVSIACVSQDKKPSLAEQELNRCDIMLFVNDNDVTETVFKLSSFDAQVPLTPENFALAGIWLNE